MYDADIKFNASDNFGMRLCAAQQAKANNFVPSAFASCLMIFGDRPAGSE